MSRQVPVLPRSGESSGGSDALSGWLIRRAARNAPPSLSERLQEEWLAALADRRGRLSRLRLAVGCCWATTVIARDYAAPLAATGRAGAQALTVHASPDPSFVSRRVIALVLIACLHTALIYALATGLVQRMFDVLPPPMQVTPLPDAPPRVLPPPPPLAHLTPERIKIPDPDFVPEVPSGPGVIRDAVPMQPARPNPPAAPEPVANRVPGGPTAEFPNTDDYYPATSKRLGEKGVATVQVCVGSDGRLNAGPAIVQSSGSARLDEGALRLARAGSGHYRPTMEDGRPVSSCFPFRIRFELR
jgi:periplasmic protein TonB